MLHYQDQPEDDATANTAYHHQRHPHHLLFNGGGGGGGFDTAHQLCFLQAIDPQLGNDGGQDGKLPPPPQPPPSAAAAVYCGGRVVRSAAGRKDRHSKVFTARGLRDRRVRLAAHTAIRFYDVQDRLGYDRPSKAVDWLMRNAKAAIDELPLPPAATAPPPPVPSRPFDSGGRNGMSFLNGSAIDAAKSFFPSSCGGDAQDQLHLSLQSCHHESHCSMDLADHHQVAAFVDDGVLSAWPDPGQRSFSWNLSNAGGNGYMLDDALAPSASNQLFTQGETLQSSSSPPAAAAAAARWWFNPPEPVHDDAQAAHPSSSSFPTSVSGGSDTNVGLSSCFHVVPARTRGEVEMSTPALSGRR